MISNCGKDENGRYTGGYSGDQTGREWQIINWYNRPWDCVIRHPDVEVGEMIAKLARAAAKNDCIGYDQWQRKTFFDQLQKNDYKVNNIKTKCEADCSSGVCSIVKAVGHRKNMKKLKDIPITTTHYMKDYFKKAGFQILTDSKYLTSDAYLMPGDILLNISHHTATNLDYGSKVKKEEPKKETVKKEEPKKDNAKKEEPKKETYIKVDTNGSGLNCRKSPSTSATILGVFKDGAKLTLIEKTNDSWYKVKGQATNGKTVTGYCSSRWLKKA